jgi:integrase
VTYNTNAARMFDPAAPNISQLEWAAIAATAPVLADTAGRYLSQVGVSLRPGSVTVADGVLRQFSRYLVEEHPGTRRFAQVGRPEIEGFKLATAARLTPRGRPTSANTIRQRLGTLRTFFDRIIEWDWDDAPPRVPIFAADLPKVDDPTPKFLDDGAAARLAREVAAEPDQLRRLVLEILSRTGLRVGEVCALRVDAMVEADGIWWLRVPLGKLHNDRHVPLHPVLRQLLVEWLADYDDAGSGLLLARDGVPLNRHVITRMVNRVAGRAGLGHIHPHQLRHTLATQAINRGMRLEAIAELLGHRTLRMTLVYARISDRTVADEYQAVTAKVEALYNDTLPPPATSKKLKSEYRRMLGNGMCARPKTMDCTFDAICEGCGFFQTNIEFRPTLQAQADHATRNHQTDRAQLFNQLLDRVDAAVT